MNDMGVSLHAHSGWPNFLDAANRLQASGSPFLFNRRYLREGFVPAAFESPVVGIERTVPIFESDELRRLLARSSLPFSGTLAEYGLRARDRLVSHFRAHWDASRPTLFAHSSGYDSRILSSCLALLRDEGFHLGTIHFRCREPEGASFLQIMKRQGWSPDQYSVFAFDGEDPLDVGAWDRPGVSPWLPVTSQINFWRDIVPYDAERDWNLCGGSGGGEAVEYPSLRKPSTIPWWHCVNEPVQRWWSYFPDGTDFAADIEARFAKVLFPYFSEEHILTIAELPDRFLGFHESGCDNIRAAILGTFKDDTLDVPRTRRTYSWSISPDRWTEMYTRYVASAFLREVPNAPPAAPLIEEMRVNFFTSNQRAERIWRLASIWETVRGS